MNSKINIAENALREIIILAILVLIVFVFNWRILYLDQVYIPLDFLKNLEPWRSETPNPSTAPLWNTEASDPVLQFFPTADYAGEARSERNLFWDPYPFAGLPAMAP